MRAARGSLLAQRPSTQMHQQPAGPLFRAKHEPVSPAYAVIAALLRATGIYL